MNHADRRLQQRAIPIEALALLQLYGKQEIQKGGSEVWYIPKKERLQLIKSIKRLQRLLEGNEGIYKVSTASGELITAGHKYKKIRTAYQ